MLNLDVPSIVDVGRPFAAILKFADEHVYGLEGKCYTFELQLSCEGMLNSSDLCGLLEIHTPDPLKISTAAPVSIQVSISHLPSQYIGRRLVLLAKVKASRDLQVESLPFTVVRYRLQLTDDNDFDRVLFNDQPGDKFLHITVQLVDSDQYRVTNKVVPLTVSLHYEDGTPVQPTMQKPNLYQLQYDQISISAKGVETIPIRILQISRNHGGRHFIVRVSPKDTENADVAYTECGPFEVRTKKVDGIKDGGKLKRPRSPTRHVTSVKRVRSPEPFYSNPTHLFETDQAPNSILGILDSHIHKVSAVRWQETRVTDEALDAKGNVVRTERISATPRNPNEFISEFIRTYDEVIRPQLQKLISQPETAPLTLQNISALTAANKDPRRQVSNMSNFSIGTFGPIFGTDNEVDNAANSLTFLSRIPENNAKPTKQISGLSLLSDISDLMK